MTTRTRGNWQMRALATDNLMRRGWVAVVLMGAVVGAMGGARAVRADEPRGGEAAEVKEPKEGEEGAEKKLEQKDPNDIRNSIGNLSMVRGFDRLSKPVRKGLWAKLVDQPYYTPAVRARKLLFFGQYEQAEGAYRALRKAEPAKQEFIEGELEAILGQGHAADVKRFMTHLAALTPEQEGTARVVRMRAEALLRSGKGPEARGVLKRFVDGRLATLDANDGETLATVMLYARVLEREAEYAAARGLYERLMPLAEGKLPDDNLAAAQLAVALYRLSTLTGDGREKHRSVMYLLSQVRERDSTYWPAYLAEAEILMNCHNEKEAGKAIAEVLDLNPNELQARFLSVEHGISNYAFEAAQANLDELKQRTDAAEVQAYEGRLLLKERLPEKAVEPLLAAVGRDPQSAEARGWLAGAYYLTNERGKMREQLGALQPGEDGAPGNAVALFECGEILRDARQFSEAEKLYLRAQGVAQWWSEPSAALAELYLETGEEGKAKESFERSFRIDPYNLRAKNQLKLLDRLQTFLTKESRTRLGPNSDQPAFIVKYDPQDAILADLALEWMEKVRPEIWGYFGITEMPAPTQIEFFPTHEQFGVRTTGLPWIGTVGASTGHVIAMDVPRTGADNAMGVFDWARTLRHEYTHTVTLALTNNRIPHWLTEAAACVQEEAPRDWDDCQLLCSNYRAGQLFKIADLNWGFIRPKRSIDRQLAYRESQWLYEYLVATYGLPKMMEFLGCFRDGLVEAQAWKKTYGKTMEEMDKEFLAWAAKQIESWGLPSEPLPKRAELEAALKKDPNDVAALYKMAWLMASSGQNAPAKKSLEKLLEVDPKHVQARELLGAVLYGMKDKNQAANREEARKTLEAVVEEDPHRPVALRTLALIAMGAKEYETAEKWFLRLQEARPLEDTSYTNLAGIYLIRGERDKAIGQLMELARHEERDERIPRKLADLLMAERKYAEAETFAYRALRINPYNAVNHELMAQVLLAERKPEQAVAYWARATELQPRVVEFWEGLAETKGKLGDGEGAAAAAAKAVALQPNSPAAKWMK